MAGDAVLDGGSEPMARAIREFDEELVAAGKLDLHRAYTLRDLMMLNHSGFAGFAYGPNWVRSFADTLVQVGQYSYGSECIQWLYHIAKLMEQGRKPMHLGEQDE